MAAAHQQQGPSLTAGSGTKRLFCCLGFAASDLHCMGAVLLQPLPLNRVLGPCLAGPFHCQRCVGLLNAAPCAPSEHSDHLCPLLLRQQGGERSSLFVKRETAKPGKYVLEEVCMWLS